MCNTARRAIQPGIGVPMRIEAEHAGSIAMSAIKRNDPDCAYAFSRIAARNAIQELDFRFRCTFCREETEIVYFVDHKPACRFCKIGITGNDNLY